MKSSIMLRRAGRDDWPTIAAIHAASWRSAYRGIYPDSYLDEEAPAERRAFWCEALGGMDPELDAVFLAEQAGERRRLRLRPAQGRGGGAAARQSPRASGAQGRGDRAAADRGGGGVAGRGRSRRRRFSSSCGRTMSRPGASTHVWAAARSEVFDAPTPGGGNRAAGSGALGAGGGPRRLAGRRLARHCSRLWPQMSTGSLSNGAGR